MVSIWMWQLIWCSTVLALPLVNQVVPGQPLFWHVLGLVVLIQQLLLAHFA